MTDTNVMTDDEWLVRVEAFRNKLYSKFDKGTCTDNINLTPAHKVYLLEKLYFDNPPRNKNRVTFNNYVEVHIINRHT